MPLMPRVKRRPSAKAGVDFGPGPVVAGGRHHLERRRIARTPDGLTGGGVEGLHHLVAALPAEQVEPVPDEERRRVAEPHLDRPLPGEPVGPRRRHVEPDDRAVAVRSPPLGRVLTGHRRRRHPESDRQRDSDHCQTLQHVSLHNRRPAGSTATRTACQPPAEDAAAFHRRCLLPGCVAPRLPLPDIRHPRASSGSGGSRPAGALAGPRANRAPATAAARSPGVSVCRGDSATPP